MDEPMIGVLVGKTIEAILVGKERVDITCVGGDCFMMYHMQDCCESVSVYDVVGDLSRLIGSTILHASEEVDSLSHPPGVPVDVSADSSFTWTIYTLATALGTVQIRWLGESNGYYSESVYFQRTHAHY